MNANQVREMIERTEERNAQIIRTTAQVMHMAAHGLEVSHGRTKVYVSTLAEAVDVCRKYIDANNYGASQLPKHFGVVRQGEKIVGWISYNGRVWERPAWSANGKGSEIVVSQ